MQPKLTTIVLDKTGTITKGKPTVTSLDVIEQGSENLMLQLAASLEQGSEHPLASSIVKAAQEKELTAFEVDSFNAVSGKGVVGNINGERRFAGQWQTYGYV